MRLPSSPPNLYLAGRTIALKDNIALAGIKCTNGTATLDWTSKIDATLTTRILDAGGLVTGKAACENACFESISDSSVTSLVHNPYADGYSCGGSSSGSGHLVASGQGSAVTREAQFASQLPAADLSVSSLPGALFLIQE